VVLRNEFLDLRRRQDPADVKEDLDIREVSLISSAWTSRERKAIAYLLELKQLGSLHEVLKL